MVEARSVDRWRDCMVAVLLAAVVLATHVASPVRTSFDSRWAIHTAVSLAYRGDADLDEYEPLLAIEEDYAVERRADRKYTRVPIGPSLVAVPVVLAYDAAAWLIGAHGTEALLWQQRAVRIEVIVASLVVAATTVLLFLVAREKGLGRAWSFVLALVFAFCTQAWSTASRGLWQHGPAMLTLTCALYLLLLARRNARWATVAGLPLALGVLMRPTSALPAAILGTYVLVRYPRRFAAFAALAFVVLGTFVALNWLSFGAALPSYFLPSGQPIGTWSDVPWVMVGHLVSPNRGLLVFAPVLVLALPGILVAVRARTWTALDTALLATLAAHFLAVSFAGEWWAGHSFGPRFTTDTVPLAIYFMIPLAAWLGGVERRLRMPVVAVALLLAAWSFFAQLRAATTWDVWAWNGSPVSVDERPERAWDWRDMQILRGLGARQDGF